MEYSSKELVEKSKIEIYSYPTPECEGCMRGIKMCKRTPCIGTVDDMEKIINAGYAKSLMLDWWSGGEKGGATNNPFEEDVSYLTPAIKGKESQKAPILKHGTCTMLTDDNKCGLHSLNLKPIQGRIACCKVEEPKEYNGGTRKDERIPILHTWNTQRGRDLIDLWKLEVGFKLKEGESDTGIDMPTNIIELMDLLLGTIKVMSDISKDSEEDDNLLRIENK